MSDHQDVFELLKEGGRMSIDDITEELAESDVRCPECGSVTREYELLREEVRDNLKTLMDQGKVGSTPDWEYKVPKRFHDD